MTAPLKMHGGFLCLLMLIFAGPASADGGEKLFERLCSGCHTIGMGDGAGPDLRGVTAKRPYQWLVLMITEPGKLSAEKDPVQLQLVKRYGMQMPDLGVSRDDAASIVAFLKAAEAAHAVKAGAAPPIAPIIPNLTLISTGRALFTGKTRFLSGGPPCMTCHDMRYSGINGSHFATDLTDSYKRIGEGGVRSVLQSHSFSRVKRIYELRPLNQAEMEALLALFHDASTRKELEGWRKLLPFGVAGFLVVFLVAVLVISRRTI